MISRNPGSLVDADRAVVPPDRGATASQPRWRRDFPIDAGQDEFVSRRELVKFMVLTSGAFVAGHVWLLVKSLVERAPFGLPAVSVATVDELPVGGAKTFQYPAGSTPRLLVRTGARSALAPFTFAFFGSWQFMQVRAVGTLATGESKTDWWQ